MTARRLADPILVPFLLILVVFGWIHDTKLAAFFGLAQIPRSLGEASARDATETWFEI